MLLEIYEILNGAGSILAALIIIFLIVKVTKGIVKGALSILLLGVIVLAVLSFMGYL